VNISRAHSGANIASPSIERPIGARKLHAPCISSSRTLLERVGTFSDRIFTFFVLDRKSGKTEIIGAGIWCLAILIASAAIGNPIACAIGAVLLLVAVGMSIYCIWKTSPICTPTQVNIQTLCDQCRERHPKEFEDFIQNSKTANMPRKKDERDSAILLAVVKFISTNDAFTPDERTDILSTMCLFPSSGLKSASSSETLRLLAEAGVTGPFIDCLARTSFENMDAALSRFLPFIEQMPENTRITFLTHECRYGSSFIFEILDHCTNPENIKLLLTMVSQFPREQRDELLGNEPGKGCRMAHKFAYGKSRNPALLKQFLDLYPSDDARLDMLKCPNEYGFTFALFLCKSSPDVIESFFSILKDFPKEDRLEILSQFSERHENVYTALANLGRSELLESPEFLACLEGMDDDERKLCMHIAPPPKAKPAHLGNESDPEDDTSEEWNDESDQINDYL
jgi:hypothetical protein